MTMKCHIERCGSNAAKRVASRRTRQVLRVLKPDVFGRSDGCLPVLHRWRVGKRRRASAFVSLPMAESGRGLPHSRTLARDSQLPNGAVGKGKQSYVKLSKGIFVFLKKFNSRA
jgi:hypothetical protein